jgi:hypothetical protein
MVLITEVQEEAMAIENTLVVRTQEGELLYAQGPDAHLEPRYLPRVQVDRVETIEDASGDNGESAK